MSPIQEAVKMARDYLNRHDPHMANFVLRDLWFLGIVKDNTLAELVDLNHTESYLVENDVLYVIERLENIDKEQ